MTGPPFQHAGAASPWLFPGESDGHKTKTTLSGQIIDRITKEIGKRSDYRWDRTGHTRRRIAHWALTRRLEPMMLR
jgi:hypothetical protein